MWLELAAIGYIVGDAIYHRLTDKPSVRDWGQRNFSIPLSDEGGTPVPLIYGRVRVRAPVIAWCRVNALSSPSTTVELLFVVGLPIADGRGANLVHGMWEGETKMTWTGTQTGDGGPETHINCTGRGFVETLNGNPAQTLADPGDDDTTAPTYVGRIMLSHGIAEGDISGYRGRQLVFLHDYPSSGWHVAGTDEGASSLPVYSFEASSYYSNGSYPAAGLYAQVGQDGNAINHLYDLLVAKHKLAIPTSLIDFASFQAAAYKLYTEGHGHSRCFEAQASASDQIQEILRQIDAAIDEDPTTGKVTIRLIRNDYDPTTIPHITKAHGYQIQNLVAGGWTNIPNRVRVKYRNRDDEYRDASVLSYNQANAVAQSDDNEVEVDMPGVCYESLAKGIANRELGWRSRPLMKLRAVVDRSFLSVVRGDAVKVTWSNPDIAGLVFRVGDVNRGDLENGRITLDLVQDASYVWRGQAPKKPDLGGIGIDNPIVAG